jgi:hypothetical protein
LQMPTFPNHALYIATYMGTKPPGRLDQAITLNNQWCASGLGSAREGVIDTLVVETGYGNVRGFSKMVLGTKLYVFYGIPYAKPPIGKRRCAVPSLGVENMLILP